MSAAQVASIIAETERRIAWMDALSAAIRTELAESRKEKRP